MRIINKFILLFYVLTLLFFTIETTKLPLKYCSNEFKDQNIIDVKSLEMDKYPMAKRGDIIKTTVSFAISNNAIKNGYVKLIIWIGDLHFTFFKRELGKLKIGDHVIQIDLKIPLWARPGKYKIQSYFYNKVRNNGNKITEHPITCLEGFITVIQR